MSQFLLGLCFEKGRGAEPDAAEAAKWYRRAAENRNADVQFKLSVCC